MHLNDWLVELQGHKRRVAYIEWHPTAENILFSAGFDHLVSFFFNFLIPVDILHILCNVRLKAVTKRILKLFYGYYSEIRPIISKVFHKTWF